MFNSAGLLVAELVHFLSVVPFFDLFSFSFLSLVRSGADPSELTVPSSLEEAKTEALAISPPV